MTSDSVSSSQKDHKRKKRTSSRKSTSKVESEGRGGRQRQTSNATFGKKVIALSMQTVLRKGPSRGLALLADCTKKGTLQLGGWAGLRTKETYDEIVVEYSSEADVRNNNF